MYSSYKFHLYSCLLFLIQIRLSFFTAAGPLLTQYPFRGLATVSIYMYTLFQRKLTKVHVSWFELCVKFVVFVNINTLMLWSICRKHLVAGARKWSMLLKIRRMVPMSSFFSCFSRSRILYCLVTFLFYFNIGQVSCCSISTAYTCHSIPNKALQVGWDWRHIKT